MKQIKSDDRFALYYCKGEDEVTFQWWDDDGNSSHWGLSKEDTQELVNRLQEILKDDSVEFNRGSKEINKNL